MFHENLVGKVVSTVCAHTGIQTQGAVRIIQEKADGAMVAWVYQDAGEDSRWVTVPVQAVRILSDQAAARPLMEEDYFTQREKMIAARTKKGS